MDGGEGSYLGVYFCVSAAGLLPERFKVHLESFWS